MTDREAFIEAIAADPADDTPRLTFADWLDEHSEPDRAEFVRLHCRLARMAQTDPDFGPTQERVKELFGRHWPEWLGPVCGAFGQHLPRFSERRGFLRRTLGRVVDRVLTGVWLSEPSDLLTRPQFIGASIWVPFDTELSHPGPALERGTIDRGLFGDLTVGASAATRSGLRDVFRSEPVTGVTMYFADLQRDWDQTAGQHLRRLRSFHPMFAPNTPAPPDALVGRILDSDDLAGVTELSLSAPAGDAAPWTTVPTSWVRLLARSKMGPRLEQLGLRAAADAVAELAGLPTDGRLHSLTIHGGYPEDPNIGLGNALARLPHRHHLSHLGVFSQSDGTAELEALAAGGAWPRLESLTWFGSEIADGGAEALAAAATFPTLKVLDLAANELTDRGAIALARAGFVRRLRSLNLGHQQITDAGAVALAESVASGPIELLSLAGNPLTEKGRRRIAHILGPKVVLSV